MKWPPRIWIAHAQDRRQVIVDLLKLDRDLEARKHLWRGLSRLSERGRLAFLAHCCTKARGPDQVARVGVINSTGTVHECFMDCCLLSAAFGQDLFAICEELERWLKRCCPSSAPKLARAFGK